MVRIVGVQDLQIRNIALIDMSYKDPLVNSGSYFLHLFSLDLGSEFDPLIKNITTKNYDLGVMQFGGFSGVATKPKEFLIEDLLFSDVVYKSTASVMLILPFEIDDPLVTLRIRKCKF